jgi:DNA-binding GntR family transcriptional regulator
VRALLEGYGAAQAAQRATVEHVEALTVLCDRMDAVAETTYTADLGDEGPIDDDLRAAYQEIAELNNEFHQTVLTAAGNAHLRSLMGGLISMPLVQRTFMRYSGERLARSMSHHRELVDAFRAGDASWASSVMTAHVRSARVQLY